MLNIRVFKVLKPFAYSSNRKLAVNAMVVESSPNILKFGKLKIGNTQDLLDEGIIKEVIVPDSYY